MGRRRSGGTVLLLGLAMLVGLVLTRDPNQGRLAPAFSLPEAYGGRIDLESYRGRPVLLVFWTTWCGVCRRELPVVNGLASEFRRNGGEVFAIHVGGSDSARDYMRSNGLSLTTLVDADGAVGRSYHVSGVPKLVLIGSDGRVKRSQAGMADESTLRDWIDTIRRS